MYTPTQQPLSAAALQEHYRMGAALAPLRSQGVLLLGSGMSFHNMGKFDRQPGATQLRVGQVGLLGRETCGCIVSAHLLVASC